MSAEHSPSCAYRAPGQLPEPRNVCPSHPQYCLLSRVHIRSRSMHVPGSSSEQPRPSQIPLSQSSGRKHALPAGLGASVASMEGASADAGSGFAANDAGPSATASGRAGSGFRQPPIQHATTMDRR